MEWKNESGRQRFYDVLASKDETYCGICKSVSAIKGAIQIWVDGNIVHATCANCMAVNDVHVFRSQDGTYVAAKSKHVYDLRTNHQ